jgi:hypothetical protein
MDQPRGVFPQLLSDRACWLIPRKFGRLSCPQLHTVGISSLLCCLPHRASKPALDRIRCWTGSIRKMCCADVCGCCAAPRASTECACNHRFIGLCACEPVGISGMQLRFGGPQEASSYLHRACAQYQRRCNSTCIGDSTRSYDWHCDRINNLQGPSGQPSDAPLRLRGRRLGVHPLPCLGQ